jgi:putative proteasome-type protease
VDYPIDTVILRNDEYFIKEKRFEQKELEHISTFWNNRLKNAIAELPSEVLSRAFEDFDLAAREV